MKTLPLNEIRLALPFIALLLVSIFVMSTYLPEKNQEQLNYDNSEEFIKVITLSAFRLD